MRLVRFSESGKPFLAQALGPPTGFKVPTYNRLQATEPPLPRRRDMCPKVLVDSGG